MLSNYYLIEVVGAVHSGAPAVGRCPRQGGSQGLSQRGGVQGHRPRRQDLAMVDALTNTLLVKWEKSKHSEIIALLDLINLNGVKVITGSGGTFAIGLSHSVDAEFLLAFPTAARRTWHLLSPHQSPRCIGFDDPNHGQGAGTSWMQKAVV
jgi:hypothetical protein